MEIRGKFHPPYKFFEKIEEIKKYFFNHEFDEWKKIPNAELFKKNEKTTTEIY